MFNFYIRCVFNTQTFCQRKQIFGNIVLMKRNLSSHTNMEHPPWREASSLIIVSRLSMHDVIAKGRNLSEVMGSVKWNYSNKPPVTDYRILMVKRSGLSSFMANAFVFPGGIVEASDYSPAWWTVFEKLGVQKEELLQFTTSVHGPRPPIIADPITLKIKNSGFSGDPIPTDIALRIAALRETFEETGILLLTNPALETGPEATTYTLVKQNIDIKVWQDLIHNDASKFIDLCLTSKMCPDVWSLYEWSDWLTPSSVGHRRYDTIFYLCCLPRQPDVLLDQGEVTLMKWCSPGEMLEDNYTNTVFLPPPQVYELSRLFPIQSYHELRSFAKKREVNGCERWLPIISTAADGAISLLPGDDMYPEEAKQGISQQFDFECPIEELRSKSKNLHRMEICGPQCIMRCNITPPYGHLQPLTFRSSQPIIQSYL